jgi:hypothetical protein
MGELQTQLEGGPNLVEIEPEFAARADIFRARGTFLFQIAKILGSQDLVGRKCQ